MTPEQRYQQLHQSWHELSGLTLPKWSFSIMHRWETLLVECDRAGMDIPLEQALPLVIARIKREARAFHGYYALLSFYRITDASRFIEQASYAIAEARKPAPSATVQAMRTLTGRPHEAPSPPARKAAEVLKSKAFQDFIKLRDNL